MADSIDCSGRGMVLNNPVICIVGPTASGKSELAQQVALRIGGEVISADSMQVYKGMDIGTGKVLPSERLVQHHGLDLIEPGQPYSAALFTATSIPDATKTLLENGEVVGAQRTWKWTVSVDGGSVTLSGRRLGMVLLFK